ncbi:hypothetical protein GCM10010417_44080 [Streptomyces carpaticus]
MGQGQLAGAGDLRADAEGGEAAQHGGEGGGFDGEGVQDVLAGRGDLIEGSMEGGSTLTQVLEIEEADQRVFVVEEVVGHGGGDGQVAAPGGVGGRDGRGRDVRHTAT